MTRAARLRRRWDRRFYRLLYWMARALFPSRASTDRVPPAALRRVLVVRDDRIGDLVVTTPALAYLRAALPPGAELDVLASPANAVLLRGDARVTHVYVNDRSWRGWFRAWRTLRARRYDLVFSPILNRHLREGLVAAMVSHPHTRRVTGARRQQYTGWWTHRVRVPRGHRLMAARLLYIAQHAVGGGRAPARADLTQYPMALAADAAAEGRVARWRADQAPAPFAALNAWATDPWRNLGVAYAADLVTRLADAHPELLVVLTPPPAAREEAERILVAARAAGAPAARLRIFPPAPDLRDLVALLRRAAVVVTPDTANVHFAVAVGTPVVGLYTDRGTEVESWRPYGVPHRTLDAPHRAVLALIPPAAVAAAVASLLAELGAAPTSGAARGAA